MDPEPPDLNRHRPALLLWLEYRFPGWLRSILDPADLVQQTLLEVLKVIDQLTARPDHEVLAYLRRALKNNLFDAIRKYSPAQGGVSPNAIAESSVRLVDWIPGDHTSPSQRAERAEQFERLRIALLALPAAQQVAVEMRYLRGMKVKDMARELCRSEGAVSLLLNRALNALRCVLDEPNT